MLFWPACTVLVAAVLLGGGTHSGFLGDAAVQLMSVPLLAAALWPVLTRDHPDGKTARIAFLLCLVPAITVLIQVAPLGLGTAFGAAVLLPAGGQINALTGGTGTALSVAPQASLAAAISLIVPLSIFCVTVRLDLQQRVRLCSVLLGLGALFLTMGFLQVAQGETSELRFYSITNPADAVGFFANRNHFAALLNVTLVLIGFWFVLAADSSLERYTLNSRSLIWLAAASAFLVADVAGLAMARSRAGIILAMAALAGIVFMALRQRNGGAQAHGLRHRRTGRASVAIAVFAVLFAAQVGLGAILSRFGGDPLDDLRVALNRTTFVTAFKALPFGTGLGSFVPVYSMVERDEDIFAGFANRAHDDLAELILETGLIGGGLLIAFLGWFGVRTVQVWKKVRPGEGSGPLLERAASLIIGLLLLHSLADYPLRTTALGSIFAFFCAILAVPATVLPSGTPKKSRSKSSHVSKLDAPTEKWGADVSWPEAWQNR